MNPDVRHIYISGPMRNYKGFNFPAFFSAEAHLRDKFPEADICNPAREDVARFGLSNLMKVDPTGLTAGLHLQNNPTHAFSETDLRVALAHDLEFICQHCDLVVVLPGWEKSAGALAEAATAKALGVPVVEYDLEGAVRRSEALETEPEAQDIAEALNGCGRPHPGPCATIGGVCLQPERQVFGDGLGNAVKEVRVTSATGGQKGTKLAAFDQISPEVEVLIAEHFGKGARKYSAHNFRKGYPWSLSYSALRRHLAAFWRGEEYDNHLPTCPEDCNEHTGSLHIVAVIWHAMVLTEFYLHHKEYDDRYVYAK